MKKIYCFIFIFILNASFFAQQSLNVQNIQIDNSGAPEEPSIIINPKSTNYIAAGANINFYYYSSDGGLTWGKGSILGTYQVWGDPCMSVDTLGNFYFFHLVNGNSFIDRMGVHKSTNNGLSYDIQAYYQNNPPKQQDKEWVAVDWTHGPRGNWMYVSWTQFDSYGTNNPADSSRILFSRSTNGGINWIDPGTRLNVLSGDCMDASNTMEGAVPAVGQTVTFMLHGQDQKYGMFNMGSIFKNRPMAVITGFLHRLMFVTNLADGTIMLRGFIAVTVCRAPAVMSAEDHIMEIFI